MKHPHVSIETVNPADDRAWSDDVEWVAVDTRDPYGLRWRTEVAYTRSDTIHISGGFETMSVDDARLYAHALLALADRIERDSAGPASTVAVFKAA